MVVAQQLPKQPIKQSVQDQNQASEYQFSYFLGLIQREGQFIPEYGTAARQYHLRRMARHSMHNTLFIGALENLKQRIIQINLEISGGRNLTRYYNEMLQQAHFGMGYDDWLSMVLDDLFLLDIGAFIEIIGPGASDTMLKRRPTGIAHLDALRCYPTGNPEFPVYYRGHRSGKLYKLHWSRVVRLTLSPHPDPEYRGMGMSLLSRALFVFQAQELMSKYQVESLDDLPPKGIVSISGVNQAQVEQAISEFEGSRQRSGQSVFRNVMRLESINPNAPVSVQITPFSTLPEAFDYDKYMSNHVNLLALALGEDPQEIWPLSSSSMGSGMQSDILHTKGRGKTFGATLKMLTRMLNLSVLPVDLEAAFKPRDTQQDKEEAEQARAWGFFTSNMVDKLILTPNEARELLAKTVRTTSSVLLDEEGQIIQLDIDDSETDEQVNQDVEDVDVPAGQTATNEGQETDEATIEDTETRVSTKDIQATRLDFEGRFEDVLAEARAGNLTRSRWSVIMRGLIARYGRRAFEDGLEHGGVSADDFGGSDTAKVKALTREQSQYVTNLGKTLFKQDGITDAQALGRAEMWWNKSIAPFYIEGQISADRNGVYEWSLGKTEEHCTDCLRLDGQIHRLRDWQKTGWLPQADKLECKGFYCDCQLSKTDGRARGRY